jgi:di/tricarboxylate transporter
LLFLFQSFKP